MTDIERLIEDLESDAAQIDHHDARLQEEDACKWGGTGTTFWSLHAMEAAEELRRMNGALRAIEAALDRVSRSQPSTTGAVEP